MSDYDLDDLLSLINEKDSEKGPSVVLEALGEIEQFCNEMKIFAGVDKVPNHVIYYTYKDVYKGDLSKIEFFRRFKKIFKQVRTGKQRRYLLDSEGFDMSREGMIKAEFFEKEQKKNIKKK
jgi:hypothetical protein